jgi:hypothetical protein
MAGLGEGQFVFAGVSFRDGFVERRLQKPEIRAVRGTGNKRAAFLPHHFDFGFEPYRAGRFFPDCRL